jgi:hypothetical protein
MSAKPNMNDPWEFDHTAMINMAAKWRHRPHEAGAVKTLESARK